MSYFETLSRYVDRQTISKNSLVEATNIDRSTFFQILSGKRFPTKEQADLIEKHLELATLERKELKTLYERERIGEKAWMEREFVSRALRMIAEAREQSIDIEINFTPEKIPRVGNIDGIYNIGDYIKRILLTELYAENKEGIDCFVSLEILQKYGFFDILKVIGADQRSRNNRIRQLVEFPVGELVFDQKNIEVIINYLFFLITQKLNYETYCYYSNSPARDHFGVLFPYYFVFSDKAILINAEGDEAVIVDDPDILNKCRELIEKTIKLSKIIVSGFENKEKYVKLIGENKDVPLYIFEKKPGISFLCTDEFINKFVPEDMHEWARWHCNALTERESYVEFITVEGLKDLMETGAVNEAGFTLNADLDDIEMAKKQMVKRLGKSLFILNSSVIPLSDNWSITVVKDRFLLLVPYLTNDRIIYLTERNIVRAFSEFCENIDGYGGLMDIKDIQNLF
ncbi:MAG: hypothetical protein IKQ71_04105 [Lachnospiraceae bacterium]|nr:hypothetical protein [Lachnospiraceae bacterium]